MSCRLGACGDHGRDGPEATLRVVQSALAAEQVDPLVAVRVMSRLIYSDPDGPMTRRIVDIDEVKLSAAIREAAPDLFAPNGSLLTRWPSGRCAPARY